CKQYEVVSINKVYWGRDDYTTCDKVPTGLTKDRMCDANQKEAFDKVVDQCRNKQACEVVATNIFFNDNSCGNVYKYDCMPDDLNAVEKNINSNKKQNIKKNFDDAEMMYLYWNDPATLEILDYESLFYVPFRSMQRNTNIESRDIIRHPDQKSVNFERNIIQRNSVCNGSKMWLECEQHDLLDIVDSVWAASNNTKCNTDTQGIVSNFSLEPFLCQQEKNITLNKVKEHCQGEMRCELMANENVLDQLDCGSKLQQVLQVDYRCMKAESRIKNISKYNSACWPE
ncbi:hypothetical protein MXB_345, partial [Myxobolus squamalis]